jgi:cbb3-type cytochrome oxidase maturation protein
MSVVVVLIGFSILVAAGFLGAFLWAVRNGQFEDRYTPSVRLLLDEPRLPPAQNGAGPQDATPPPAPVRRHTFRNHHTQGS